MKAQPTRRASFRNSVTSLANRNTSTVSLVLAEQPTARSGHSYLPEGVPLKKVKSRSDCASIFSHKSSASTLRGKGKGKGKAKDKDRSKDRGENEGDANKPHTWFSKITNPMRRLFHNGKNERQGAMKWEDFLKVFRACSSDLRVEKFIWSQGMRDMGFECGPSGDGSAVTFNPPDKKDKVCFNVLRSHDT